MQKKNKLMLAAAIGMVAIVIGSTAVRCSVTHTVEERTEPAGTGAAVESTVQTRDAGRAAQEAPEKDAAAETLTLLRSNAWQAEGAPERTLAFREGSFVESDGTSVRLTAFEVKDAGEAEDQRYLDIDIMREGDPYATQTTLIVDEKDGALSVACDGFAMEKRYVQGAPSGAEVAVSGLAEPYTGLIDGKAGELASAIGQWCQGHAPTATSASFDGEVYVDVRGGRVSATFHLDDAAATIVTAVYEGGAFSVAG